jgi:hypothetical protein
VCTPPKIQRYVSKDSGPLLDRIDIHIEVPAVQYKKLRGGAAEGADEIRARALVRGSGSMCGSARRKSGRRVAQGSFSANFCRLTDEYAANSGLLRIVFGCGAFAGSGDVAAGVKGKGA